MTTARVAPPAGDGTSMDVRRLEVAVDHARSVGRGDRFDEDFVRARRKVVQELLGEATVPHRLAGRGGRLRDARDVQRLVANELDPRTEIVVCRGRHADLVRAFDQAGLSPATIVELDDH